LQIMKNLKILFLLFLTGCSTLPQFYQSIEKIADDDAINVMISQEAIQKQKDVIVMINITNPSNK